MAALFVVLIWCTMLSIRLNATLVSPQMVYLGPVSFSRVGPIRSFVQTT